MDSFEVNKIVGAVLGTVFVLFGGSLLAESIFHSEAPEQPGFVIEAPEEPEGGGGAAEEAAVPIATLLQTADAEAGTTVFRRCQSCHTAEEGGANGVGPNLWGVVNRPIAGHEGFSYSAAMTDFSQGGSVVWDYEHLNGFLLNPRSYVPGTAMAFAGLANDEDRANLIAYLRTLAAEPAPLPEPPAEGEAAPPEGEAAPAEGEAAAPAEGEAAAPPEGGADPASAGAGATAPETPTDIEPGATEPQTPATTDPATGEEATAPLAPGTGQTQTGDNATAAPPQAETPGAQGAAPAQGEAAPAEQAPAEASPAPAAPATPDPSAPAGPDASAPAADAPAAQGTTIVPADPASEPAAQN